VQKRWQWLLFNALYISGITYAAQEDVHPPSADYHMLGFSGYIDGSYNYLLNSNQFTSGTLDRIFDTNQNGFTPYALEALYKFDV